MVANASRSPSISGATYASAATTSTTMHQQSSPPNLSTSLIDATNSLANYLNQQKSLDIAKMHLERYLKVTNQYLHATLDGTNLTANEQINHLIRTNILTNKIAANNLISIINKLLEQNMISEYYFKHASRMMMQQTYDNASALNAAGVHGFSDAGDKDGGLFAVKTPPLSPVTSIGQSSELLKELIKHRDIRFHEHATDEKADPNASDHELNEQPSNKLELLDYDDTIKKETIPVHSNPFMSYLHMHLNRTLDKSKGDSKFYNGNAVSPLPNALSPNDQSAAAAAALTSLIAAPPIESKPSKSQKKRSNHTNSINSFSNNNNNHSSHLKLPSHNSPFDLALNLSQRLYALFNQQQSNMHILLLVIVLSCFGLAFLFCFFFNDYKFCCWSGVRQPRYRTL